VIATIIRIESAGPERRARRLVFDQGLEPRETSAAALKALGLVEGVAVDSQRLEADLQAIEGDLAKVRALQLLGYRERCEAELTRKLIATGYSSAIARSVVQRYVEVELVDDRRFATAFARIRVAAGYGDRRIARELADKGVPEELALEALEGLHESGDEAARARRALRGRVARDRREADKLVRRLVSRGFSVSVALQALEVDTEDVSNEE